MVLPENRQFPGDWCVNCPAKTTLTADGRKEPCATIMEKYRHTGEGSGLNPGEVVCNASLQAEFNTSSSEQKLP